ncbi:MAG: CDP-glycerol glycerophosphotransferase family protein [Candidatus Marinimicrobia bacterium]|nr:CDP-glycerol glycerophosphotransferase family protein [Candidatus Neomarinimicrobiota bacterium]
MPIYWISSLIPKNSNVWVFGAWYGQKYSDNSKAVFEFVNKKNKNIKAIWLSKNKKVIKKLRQLGYKAHYPYGIFGYLYCLRAGKCIVSSSFITDVNKFAISKNTKKILLWHGVPIKKVGKSDKIEKNMGSNVLIKKIKYTLFPNLREEYDMITVTSKISKEVFVKGFDIDRHRVKITGYPRNDMLIKNIGYNNKDRFEILYAPTFRGDVGSEFKFPPEVNFNQHKIDEYLEKNNMFLYVRLHYANKFSEELLKSITQMKNASIFDCCNINEHLGRFDLLITDYSGIYIDYLLLGRPIIFFPFDYKEYIRNERELVYEYDKITPGPKAYSWDDILKHIDELIRKPSLYKKDIIKVRNIFHKYIDGKSSCRVYYEIMKL